MKRSEIVPQADFTPPPEQQVLVYREGRYQHLTGDRTVHAGESVVLYDLDLANEAELIEANSLFSPQYYVRAKRGPRDDEARVIAELIPESGAEVLDACCGAGRLSAALVRGGNHVTAVDVSEGCIAHAVADERYAAPQEARRPVDFRVANALQLPFADQSFEVVCCLGNALGNVLSGRRQVLAELVRVCRRRLILGLREDPDQPGDQTQIYASPHGFLEFTKPHSLQTFRPFLDLLPGAIHFRKGDPLPWRGQNWFLAVDLGTDSAPGGRNT